MLIFDNYDNPGAFGDIKSYFPSGTSWSPPCLHMLMHIVGTQAPTTIPILACGLVSKPFL